MVSPSIKRKGSYFLGKEREKEKIIKEKADRESTEWPADFWEESDQSTICWSTSHGRMTMVIKKTVIPNLVGVKLPETGMFLPPHQAEVRGQLGLES